MNSKIAKIIATFFYSGFSKLCPGTVGSILTLPLWFIIICIITSLKMYGLIPLIIGIIFLVGYYATKKYITDIKKDDPSEVVIDEVVGQLLSFYLSFGFLLFWRSGVNLLSLIENYKILFYVYFFILPIILFRIYDIRKPWIIGKIDSKMKNAMGVMLDDVVGGIFAGITNSILMLIFVQFIA